jgi:hypothetical protein
LVLTAAANQGFLMGFFFFLSGYFSARSLTRYSPARYFQKRLARLGLPVLLFVYLISPLIRWFYRSLIYQEALQFQGLLIHYQDINFGIELGPMWFVMLLLILSILAIPWKSLVQKKIPSTWLPSRREIILFAFLIGTLTFLVRIYLPVGYVFQPLNLQVPYTLKYIALFLAGVIAYQNRWLEGIDQLYSPFWARILPILILIMPVIFILSGGLTGDISPALGGFHWQSLSYALWEPFFCLAMILTLTNLFHKRGNRETRLTRELAASSYSAYIIHSLILVVFAASLRSLLLDPLPKIVLLILPALILCFLAAGILRRLPGLNRIM